MQERVPVSRTKLSYVQAGSVRCRSEASLTHSEPDGRSVGWRLARPASQQVGPAVARSRWSPRLPSHQWLSVEAWDHRAGSDRLPLVRKRSSHGQLYEASSAGAHPIESRIADRRVRKPPLLQERPGRSADWSLVRRRCDRARLGRSVRRKWTRET